MQLASGFLPLPNPISPPPHRVDRTPVFDHDDRQEFGRMPVDDGSGDFASFTITSPLRRNPTSAAIKAQLSNITAPVREDEDSDSSGSCSEADDNDSDWNIGDTSDPSAWKPSLALDLAEMEEDGEVMYGMHIDDDDFWSQYPGLD